MPFTLKNLTFRQIVIAAATCLFAVGIQSCAPSAKGDGVSRDTISAESANALEVVTQDGARHKFDIELADTDEERRVGLMYRTELAEDAGMLFDFGPEPQQVGIWMKNTLIPLDIIFIDEDGTIIRIQENAVPRSLQSMKSGRPALAVLEVNGGRTSALGISAGDKVVHPLFSGE